MGESIGLCDFEFRMEVRQNLTPLEPGGILAFNVAPAHSFYYWGPKEIHAWPGEWKQIANKELEDGKRLLVYHHKIFEDTVAQYAVRERRYELYEGDRLVTTPNDRAVGLLGGQAT